MRSQSLSSPASQLSQPRPIRQGDVILTPVEATPMGGKKLDHLTLAEGEVTGHRHRISSGDAELYADGEVLYLTISSEGATLSHEEHRALQIPQGTWIVRIQREYDPEAWHLVED